MDRFLTVTHMGENGTAKKAILSLPVSFINPKLLHYQTLQEIKYHYLFFYPVNNVLTSSNVPCAQLCFIHFAAHHNFDISTKNSSSLIYH